MNSPEAPASSESSPPPAKSRSLLAPFEGAPVVLVLTAANLLVFGLEVLLDGSASALLTPSRATMLKLGANYPPATLLEWRWETLITSCFLHYGVIHLAFNMIALRQIGPFLERAVGSGRLALMYLVTGIGGSAASAGWSRVSFWLANNLESLDMEMRQNFANRLHGVSAGASGAICGLIGAALVIGIRAQGWRGDLTRGMARWLGMIVVIGFFLPADNAAHVGGAVLGALVAAMWKREPESPKGRKARLAFTGLAIFAAAVRLVQMVTTQPYATLAVDGRLKLSEKLEAEGRCEEANEARAAAARLAPEAVKQLQLWNHLCK